MPASAGKVMNLAVANHWIYLPLCLCSKFTGLQIRVQHWGDDQHILATFLIWGDMILRFLVWENFRAIPVKDIFFSFGLAMTKLMFFYSFSPDFLMTFFFKLFPHFLLEFLSPYKNFLPCVFLHPKIFSAGGKILWSARQWAKIKIYWGYGGQILGGGCIPLIPPDLQPCKFTVYTVHVTHDCATDIHFSCCMVIKVVRSYNISTSIHIVFVLHPIYVIRALHSNWLHAC